MYGFPAVYSREILPYMGNIGTVCAAVKSMIFKQFTLGGGGTAMYGPYNSVVSWQFTFGWT